MDVLESSYNILVSKHIKQDGSVRLDDPNFRNPHLFENSLSRHKSFIVCSRDSSLAEKVIKQGRMCLRWCVSAGVWMHSCGYVTVCMCALACLPAYKEASLRGGGAIITANKTTTNKQSLFWASPCCTTPLHKTYFIRATDTGNVLRCAA